MYTPPWLWRPAMNHGCLHIHPFGLVLLSDFIAVCRLQSSMFMVLSCHVLCSALSHRGVKEGIDYVEIRFFFSIKYSARERKPPSVLSASSRFAEPPYFFSPSHNCVLASDWLVFHFTHVGFHEPSQAGALIYYDMEFIPLCHAPYTWRIVN